MNRPNHISRRALLKATGVTGLSWLTPLSEILALDAEKNPRQHPRSVILLWLAGGPSQLETFDPHPGTQIAAGTQAINTNVPNVQLAQGLDQVAEVMDHITLLRSVVSKEGDHERASYNMKTGYRPDPTVVHPALGAVISHEMPNSQLAIPAHISILPNDWPARGGYLGAQYDAFKVSDPAKPIPDVQALVGEERQKERLQSLSVVEETFQAGRPRHLDDTLTLHNNTIRQALKMMGSEQLKAFDISEATETQRAAYGNTRFGRGCLAAVRLIQTGVRCVEVTLKGWDSHVNNHETQTARVQTLDPAFAALIRDLKERELLDHTLVLCGGEFGRTPKINPPGGRDHWPHGFSFALAGGGIPGGRVIGETDPSGEKEEPVRPIKVQDIHATVLSLLGIDPDKELITPVGRPLALSNGSVIKELL